LTGVPVKKTTPFGFFISNNSFTSYTVSHVLGFGLMDAEAMVTQAKTWKLVTSQMKCTTKTIYVYRYRDVCILQLCHFIISYHITRKYKYLVIGMQYTYFIRYHSKSRQEYFEANIEGMLGFLEVNIYVVFGDQVVQQSVGIPMDTNCAPLLADLFSYSHEAEFVQKLLGIKPKTLPCPSNIHTDLRVCLVF
jgi:hypothetical protein